MKKPKLSDLDHDAAETGRIRFAVKKPRGIKITINIDSESLTQLRELAGQTGIPYQRLLNKLLREGLDKSSSTETRLQKLV